MSTTIQIEIPPEIKTVVQHTLDKEGLTINEIAQRVLQPIMQRIFQEQSIPVELLALSEEDKQSRRKAIERIQLRRKQRQAPVASMEEIIAWRDEGRA